MLEMKRVHNDERGEIYVIPLSKDKDIAICTTNKGYARGGGIHKNNDEFFTIIKGIVQYVIDGKEKIFQEGMSGFIPHDTPHMMRAKTDSITMEWGATIAEKQTYNAEYRKLVEKINRCQK